MKPDAPAGIQGRGLAGVSLKCGDGPRRIQECQELHGAEAPHTDRELEAKRRGDGAEGRAKAQPEVGAESEAQAAHGRASEHGRP